jgi:integrase
MKIEDLLTHYHAVKSLHAPIPASLADKLTHLSRVFGPLEADTTGSALVRAATTAWPKAAPGTIKRYLVQLRAVMSRALKDGLIDRQPVIDVPYVHDVVYVDVSTAEVKLLLTYIKWTEAGWYPLALVLAHTGARLGEAMALTPDSFTRHGTRIAKPTSRRSKTVDRVIPYTACLLQAVASGVIFSNERLVPPGIADASVSTCLGRVLDEATKAIGLPPMRVHDLRHAFAGMLAENGADIADLVTALGHSSTSMSMRYRGLIKGRLNTIMSAI